MDKIINMPLGQAMIKLGKKEGVSFREASLMFKLWQKCKVDEVKKQVGYYGC